MSRRFCAGVFGRRADPQVRCLGEALEALGARAVVVDFHAFPRLNLATAAAAGAAGEARPWSFDDLRTPGTVDLRALDVIHLRTVCSAPLSPEQATGIDAAGVAEHHANQVTKAAFQIALLERLGRRIPVINPPRSFRHHRLKGAQHARLLGAGLVTPAALVTTDEGEARAFARRYPKVVVKPQGSGAEVVLADEAFFVAQRARFGRRPYLFQQFVGGRSLRVYLLGGRVVSAGEIHHDRRHVDWRERTLRVTPLELEPALAADCGRAVRLLDLPYCGIDIEWDASTNRYYFLDFNPSALYVGWGQLARIDMAQEIARYLGQVVAADGDPWLGSEEGSGHEQSTTL